LTGNQHFETAGVIAQGSVPNFSGFAVQNFGNGVKVDYNAASDSYTLTSANGTVQTFAPANIDNTQVAPGTTVWDKTSGNFRDLLILQNVTVGGVPLSYTLIGNWAHINQTTGNRDIQFAVGGVPTIASDMPKSGTASYNVDGGGNVFSNGIGYNTTTTSTFVFSANFGTGTLTTSLHLLGAVPGGSAITDFGTANGTGSVTAGTSAFNGSLTMNNNTGAFTGSFFGPQASEMAYDWYLTGQNFTAFGVLLGIKK
jgi:hypothetical protein